jgi:hypothetical protein
MVEGEEDVPVVFPIVLCAVLKRLLVEIWFREIFDALLLYICWGFCWNFYFIFS